VRLTADAGAAIVPVGAGYRAARLRGLGERRRVHLSSERLDQVVQLDETSLLCHVQAGLTGPRSRRSWRRAGCRSATTRPASSARPRRPGRRAHPGKSSARHGFFEDAVAGVSAVLADGRTIHTRVAPRRSTGPDLARALCGSEGTLGFITAAVLRLHRRPEARLLAAYVLPSVDAAIAAAFLALREECAPAGLRIVDAAEARLHFPGRRPRRRRGAGGRRHRRPHRSGRLRSRSDRQRGAAEGGRRRRPRPRRAVVAAAAGGEPTPRAGAELQISAAPSAAAPAAYHAVRRAVPGRHLHVSRFDRDGAVLFATWSTRRRGRRAPAPRRPPRATAAGGWLLGVRPPRSIPTWSRCAPSSTLAA
jgi:FAD/FMN-containing dehydrogenase